jgi:hypothetical protein
VTFTPLTVRLDSRLAGRKALRRALVTVAHARTRRSMPSLTNFFGPVVTSILAKALDRQRLHVIG